ncbi:MAG: ImmA/IrrE family metallo-endopeptidase [Ruminococcus sp.]
MSTAIVKPRSKVDIVKLAKATRSVIGADTPYFDVCKFIEIDLPKYDATFSYEYVESSDLPENTYAYYDPINNVMKIEQDVYLLASSGNGRHRFTIAHEIGHYFTSDEYGYTRKLAEDIPIYFNPEWQANVYAAELLMPSEMIVNMTVDEIVEKCQVSRQAAIISLKNAKKPNHFKK